MYVKSLSLKDFRNYETLSLDLSPGTTILYGKNAQGKTNILEAVYLAGTTKSHRGSKDRDMIRMGMDESHIRMFLMKNDNEYRIDMHLKRNRPKGAAINGQPVRKAADLFGIASFVFFSPEDLGMVKNGPAGRRHFTDILLSGIDPIYMSDLQKYSKIINQRNALLHDLYYRPDRMSELDVWDMQLVSTGRRIIERREEFIKEFSVLAAEKHLALTDGKEKLFISYEANTSSEEIEDKVRRTRESDLRTKTTGAGPHRDDLCIRANDMDLRIYGSQGQQRTAALSMKMAEISVIGNEKHVKPVLLLDDVLSELDESRQKALLSGIRDTQTLITCTGLDEFVQNRFEADRIFKVTEGTVTEN